MADSLHAHRAFLYTTKYEILPLLLLNAVIFDRVQQCRFTLNIEWVCGRGVLLSLHETQIMRYSRVLA
jgi:hypothetical protein